MPLLKSQPDNFTNVPLRVDNLDIYVVRKAILHAINESLPYFKGHFLDMGCGRMPYRKLILDHSEVAQYVGLDIHNAIEYDEMIKPDYTWDGVTMPFNDNSFDTVMATEVLEHCPDPAITLNEVHRVLRPGGSFFFTTPFVWNLHEVPHDEYRFTPFSLERHLKANGFVQVAIHSAGGWHASLAQMLGLWARRAPMNATQRSILSGLLKPVIAFLLKKDVPPKDFNGSRMLTTIYGTAIKDNS